jgi:H+-transporting ATPase
MAPQQEEPPTTAEQLDDVELGPSKTEKDSDLDSIPDTLVDYGLREEQVPELREKFGWNEIPAPSTPLYVLFLRQFTGFLPILIEVAAIVSLAVQDYQDFGIIVGILLVNACLGFREEYHAKKSLDELSNSLESEITVRRDGETKSILTKELVPGDICMLVGGTVVPADVKFLKGDKMSIDTAALTGEPLPRKYPSDEYGDVIMSGTTVAAGECYGIVLHTGINTEIGRAQSDVLKDKSVRVVSVFQKKIMTIVQIFVAFSLAFVVGVLLVLGLVYNGFQKDYKETILAALSILIASIPVALPLVVQVNLALGAAFLAKEHSAIVTSIPALQDIASMSQLCSDKTGTLTTAKMSIIRDQIVAIGGFTKEDVIRYAKLCSNADKKDDPIDKAVLRAYEESEVSEDDDNWKQTEIIGFNPVVKRVVAFVKHNGQIFTVAKGLPAKIIDTTAGGVDDHECQWKVEGADSPKFVDSITTTDAGLSKSGYKTIAIAMCTGDARTENHGPWKFVGLMPMLDPPREDTKATIASLNHANISVKMITGDHLNVGKETARLIGLGQDMHAGEEIRNATNPESRNEMTWNADGFAAVLPSDKREVVLTLKNVYGVVTGMTGDGVNDAPALSAAQVGIAVEGATDAAKNAADLILTEPGLRPIYGAVLESRRIFARIKSYVVYRMAASAMMVLSLSILAFVSGVSVDSLLIILLALFNDISMLPVAYDNADATTKPQLPNTLKLILVSLYYGFVQTAFTLALIFGLDASTAQFEDKINLENDTNKQTGAFIWLQLVLVTELAIFSVRAPTYFWRSMPSLWLVASVIGTCIMCTFISVCVYDLSWANAGFIWLFNIVTFIIVDIGKVGFRNMINDAPGDIIENDDLITVDENKTEVERFQEKQARYNVHRESALDPADFERCVEIVDGPGSLFDSFARSSITDNYGSHMPGAQLHVATAGRKSRVKMTSAPELNFRI